jgi:hypothetical protein
LAADVKYESYVCETEFFIRSIELLKGASGNSPVLNKLDKKYTTIIAASITSPKNKNELIGF